jgi:hypothetical protein
MRLVQQTFRFLTLVLAGVVLSLALGHVLTMSAKLALAPRDYLMVQRIYGAFGTLGAIVEPAAVACAIVLAFLVRRGRAYGPAVVGALCLVAALLIWVAIVNPTSGAWRSASPEVPDNFESLRMRWEWGQAARGVLTLVGFVSLVIAVLIDMSAAAAAAVKLTVPQATTTNTATATRDDSTADAIAPPDTHRAA